MQKLRIELKPERLIFELSVQQSVELDDAIKMVLSMFPGAKVEGIGGPLFAVRAVTAQVEKSEAENLEGFIIRTPPYLGKKLSDMSLETLREWFALDSGSMSPQERVVIANYLRGRK